MSKKLKKIEDDINNEDIVIQKINNMLENTISDGSENGNGVVKRQAGRPKGSSKKMYVKEKEYVILKMNSILGLTKDVEIINADEINDVNNSKHKEILECVSEIKKYFNAGSWRYFVVHSDKLSLLIKNLYCAYGYDVKQTRATTGSDVVHQLTIKRK